MSGNHSSHIVHAAVKIVEKLPPLAKKKNPAIAAAVGFLFGPLGIGAYLESRLDFCWCMALLVALAIIVPGLGLILGWLFCAGFAFYRVVTSNEKLEAAETTALAA